MIRLNDVIAKHGNDGDNNETGNGKPGGCPRPLVQPVLGSFQYAGRLRLDCVAAQITLQIISKLNRAG